VGLADRVHVKRRTTNFVVSVTSVTRCNTSDPLLGLKWLINTFCVFGFSCVRGDYLKVFLHLDRGEVNEFTPAYGLLCGSMPDVPHLLFSSESSLVLEFHSDRIISNSSGFLGNFRFLNRSKSQHSYKLSVKKSQNTEGGSRPRIIVKTVFPCNVSIRSNLCLKLQKARKCFLKKGCSYKRQLNKLEIYAVSYIFVNEKMVGKG